MNKRSQPSQTETSPAWTLLVRHLPPIDWEAALTRVDLISTQHRGKVLWEMKKSHRKCGSSPANRHPRS